MTIKVQAGVGRVAGKVAIVTGAGADGDGIGIGRAIAMLLAREGAAVACLDMDRAKAEATAKSIQAEGGTAVALVADVSNPDACIAAVAETVAAIGNPAILVNNVGITGQLNLASMDLAAWQKTFDVNVTGAMLMARAVLAPMQANGGGSIINISSISGITTMGALAYGPSKAALHQLSREIAVLHGRDGIRVNTVAPGHMATPMAMRLLPPEMREKRRKISPLGIEGNAWDVAHAVLFLASDEARFVNGVHLPVDGGVTAIAPLTGAALLEE